MVELAAQHAHTAVVANRCDPGQLDAVARGLQRSRGAGLRDPRGPLLVAPTVGELQTAVDGILVHGDPSLLGGGPA